MTPIPNGLDQTFTAVQTKLAELAPVADAKGADSLSPVITKLQSMKTTALKDMTSFAGNYKEMKIYSMASSATEDVTTEGVIGGVCELMRDCANGKILDDLKGLLDQLEDGLMDGATDVGGELLDGAKAAIRDIINDIDLDIDGTSGMITALSDMTGSLTGFFKGLTDQTSQFMMLIGGELGFLTATTECFAAAAVFNPEVGAMYQSATAIQADLANGTISSKNLPYEIRQKMREATDFTSQVEGAVDGLPSLKAKDAMSGAIKRFKDKKQASLEPPTPPETPIDADPDVEYDFSADKWSQQVGQWDWGDTNSVALAESDPRESGVVVYNALSSPQWRGRLQANIQSLAGHKRAAGLVLGRNSEGLRVGILKRGTSGLGLYVFEAETLNVPSDYVVEEDHTSGQSFDAWIDIPGVELQLVADETHFTVTARELGTSGPMDMLQIPRADLAMIEVGLIALGDSINFHLQEREDE